MVVSVLTIISLHIKQRHGRSIFSALFQIQPQNGFQIQELPKLESASFILHKSSVSDDDKRDYSDTLTRLGCDVGSLSIEDQHSNSSVRLGYCQSQAD